MDAKELLIREIIGFLNENAEYAVLRNYEQLPVATMLVTSTSSYAVGISDCCGAGL